MKKTKDGTVLKSDIFAQINGKIRAYIVDNNKYDVVLALYELFDAIDDMPVREAKWVRDADGAWKCSHCGYRFWNGVGKWVDYCENCGYEMIQNKN